MASDKIQIEHVALDKSYISPLSEMNSNISSNCSHDLIEIEELLIEEVSKREVLYNYNLPLAQCNRTRTNQAWEAISEALQGRLNPKEAAKRWRILRDSYYRKLSEEKLPSGSGRPSIKRKWKYFEQLDFLRDISLKKRTISNIHNEENEENFQPIKKKSRSSNLQSESTESNVAINKIADAITAMSNVPKSVQLPPLPPQEKQDEVDGLFLIIGTQIRKLPQNERNNLIFEIMSFVKEKILCLSHLL